MATTTTQRRMTVDIVPQPNGSLRVVPKTGAMVHDPMVKTFARQSDAESYVRELGRTYNSHAARAHLDGLKLYGKTYAEIARALNVSTTSVYRWAKGKTYPSNYSLDMLATYAARTAAAECVACQDGWIGLGTTYGPCGTCNPNGTKPMPGVR